MRMVLDPRKHQYVPGVSIFLVMVVLTVGIVGCDGVGSQSCTLTITSSAGGSVTDPGEGTFSYDEGAVVNLVATADDGYGFQGWTGDTEGVADPGSRTTTMILSQDSSITANFGQTDPGGPSRP
jgi:hypothetical protein